MKIKALVMEFIGTGLLVAAILGAGYTAAGTTQDAAVGLIINSFAAAAMLAIIIRVGAKISGAHYNPAVTLALLLSKKVDALTSISYIVVQVAGAISGAFLANAMYGAHIYAVSTAARTNSVLMVSEVVATAGLVWVILRNANNANKVALFAPLWIFSAYFFTSSTTFANPAATIGRIFTQSPAGIAPASILRFIGAQFLGAAIGWILHTMLTDMTVMKSDSDATELEGGEPSGSEEISI